MSVALAAATYAQEPLQPQPDAQQSSAPQTSQAQATLHGVVRDAASGEPLPRALVSVEGDAATAALTDGDGKFEIPNLPVGPVIVALRKPGYFDNSTGDASEMTDEVAPAPHNVMLAQDMPDVEFSLMPAGAILGQIDLSSGESAEGISLNLMRLVLMGGRAGWALAGHGKTRSDGTFRFGDLTPGVYELYSEPALDSENLNLPVAAGRGGAARQWGFATVYYPDARDSSGAQRIKVAPGATVQVNLTLMREAFQTVSVTPLPPAVFAGRSLDYEVQVRDLSGRVLPYPARYDSNAKLIEASLPDGSYRLTVTSTPRLEVTLSSGPRLSLPGTTLQGAVDVQVSGQPVTNVRVALMQAPQVQVDVNVLESGGQPSPTAGQFVVTASQAAQTPGQLPDANMMTEVAAGQLPGPLIGQAIAPGAYWVHMQPSAGGYCESSFTAGGANLAREPLLVGPAGVQAPLELTLRNDCAKLTVSLPESLDASQAGEEKFYSVYAIPDFDSTVDPQEATLRPSSGGAITLNGLTPGNYHVYTLRGNASFEYRNPAVLAALPSQAVTLSPGATAELVVQAQ